MNDIYASFGFIDLIVIGCGFYGFYSWHQLVHKHEIKKMLLLGGDATPERCTDIEGFAGFIGPKLMILSVVMVIFGSISAYNSFGSGIGNLIWPCMAVFLGVIIWYCVQLRKADKLYFDHGAKKGTTIKEKALKK